METPHSRVDGPSLEEEGLCAELLADGALAAGPHRSRASFRAGLVMASFIMVVIVVVGFFGGWHSGNPAVLSEVQGKVAVERTTAPTTLAPTYVPIVPPAEKVLAREQQKVQDMRDHANEVLGKAKKQAKDMLQAANAQGTDLVAKSKHESQQLLAHASALEKKALKQVASTRTCVDLPGTKLAGEAKLSLEAAVVDPNATTPESCNFWCRAHDACAQAVFSIDDEERPVCEWFAELSEDPLAFGNGMNSSYCGPKAAEKTLVDALKRVFKKKPWVPENPNCAWSGENCLDSKCCANTCSANLDFTKCDWFTCYKKDEYYASCQRGPAAGDWDGTVLGGHAAVEVEKAPAGVLTQGTKLFCFCVVMWSAGPSMGGAQGEGEVANGWKSQGLSIMQCDEHAFFDGWPTGSEHNIDSFTNAWNQVKESGRWKFNDWTVKVDADAVFFPERLRWHIQALRTPFGSRVYLRNTFFKFNFLGAIEVLTREAVATYFERSSQCDEHLTKEGGEDYYLLQCLEGIGVNYQSDYELLVDKYAAQNDCYSDWAVAFHFYKSVDTWMQCRDAAQQTWQNSHAGQ